MEPTILVGDQVFAQRVSAHLGDTPEVGDIVVFKNPISDSSHEILSFLFLLPADRTNISPHPHHALQAF